MKLSEIYEIRDEDLQRALAGVHKQAKLMRGRDTPAKPDPAASVRELVAKIAGKFEEDQFAEFVELVNREAPGAWDKINLEQVFSHYNASEARRSGEAWADYGRLRAAGDPSVVGKDGWTGD